jgi:predicted DsbA family dithiol-disulfide isomerase
VPYFLEPDYDETKAFIESNRDRLLRKWGGHVSWQRQKQRHDLKGRGEEAGIKHFNLDRLAANTMASHRLIQHMGKEYGLAVSEAVYDLLNVYYFVEGHSLNDRPRMATTVAEALVPILGDRAPSARKLLDFLNGSDGRAEIEKAVRALHQLRISGIPKFIIEGTTLIDGAAHADTFVTVFREIEARGYVLSGPVFGEILGVPSDVINQGSHCSGACNK